MKILITGSRKLYNETAKKRLRNELLKYRTEATILHGGAKGADQMADELAKELGLEVEVIRPDYKTYHYKEAPLKRNTELVSRCDRAIALYAPDRVRKGGTWDTVKKAMAANKPVTELMPNGEARDWKPNLLLL